MRHNFEVNVFAPMALTQKVVRKWVESKASGKIVSISSMGGLFSPPAEPARPPAVRAATRTSSLSPHRLDASLPPAANRDAGTARSPRPP